MLRFALCALVVGFVGCSTAGGPVIEADLSTVVDNDLSTERDGGHGTGDMRPVRLDMGRSDMNKTDLLGRDLSTFDFAPAQDLSNRDLSSNIDLFHPADFAPVLDLSGRDLALPPGDMAVGPDGCNSYSLCVGDCFANATTQTEYEDCVIGTCNTNSTANGRQLLIDALQCGVDHCVTVGRCFDENDSTDDCLTCQFNATAFLLNFQCNPIDDPDCNTSACMNAVDICIADTP